MDSIREIFFQSLFKKNIVFHTSGYPLPILLFIISEKNRLHFNKKDVNSDGKTNFSQWMIYPLVETRRHQHPGILHYQLMP